MRREQDIDYLFVMLGFRSHQERVHNTSTHIIHNCHHLQDKYPTCELDLKTDLKRDKYPVP